MLIQTGAMYLLYMLSGSLNDHLSRIISKAGQQFFFQEGFLFPYRGQTDPPNCCHVLLPDQINLSNRGRGSSICIIGLAVFNKMMF